MEKDSLQRKSKAVVAKIDCVLRKEPQKLAEMNKGKEGRPFLYSNELIISISFFRFYFCPKLRQTETLVRRMYGYSPDYTTIDRRLSMLKLEWTIRKEKRRGRRIAIDASGISVSNRGGWRDAKYGSKPRFYKLHLVMDEEAMEPLAFRLTSEHVGDNREFSPMMNELARKIKISIIHGDGGYDAKDNFDYLDREGVKAGIKVDKNSSLKSRGSVSRRTAVREQFGYPDVGRTKTRPPDGSIAFMDEAERRRHYQRLWKSKVGYGKRWLIEAFFSVFKRVYGSYASSHTWKRVKNEMMLKLLLYNELLKA